MPRDYSGLLVTVVFAVLILILSVEAWPWSEGMAMILGSLTGLVAIFFIKAMTT